MAAKSKSDLAATLAKMPPAKRAAILGAVLAALGLLYWQFFYSGLKESEDSEKSTHSRLMKEQKKIDVEKAELKKLTDEHNKLKKSMEGIQLALPTEPELASFIDHLQIRAGDAQVNFKSWDNRPEVPVDKYIKVPLAIEVTGTFYQIMHFFHLLGPKTSAAAAVDDLGETKKLGRIVSIESLRIGEATVKNDEILLSAKFMASTFRQESPKEPPPAAKAKDKKDKATKKGGVRDSTKKREEAVEKKSGEGAGDKGTKRLTNPGADLNPK
jgi:Tfp pilus assembly protein PilO